MSEVHLVTLVLIMVIAAATLLEHQRVGRGGTVRYPNWPLIATAAGAYVLINLVLVARTAWH